MTLKNRGTAYRLAALSVCITVPCQAHGFGGSGLLHPLTGIDHMLAMLAIGAWSAQRGGAAIYRVPIIFVLSVACGAGVALLGTRLPAIEYIIALSVMLLGATIAMESARLTRIAMLTTPVFGVAHGYSHGLEILRVATPFRYIAGFLVTTAGLHVFGAVAALLVLGHSFGVQRLRWAGALSGIAGAVLFLRLF